MRHAKTIGIATLFALFVLGTALGAEETILIRASNVTMYTPSDTTLGDFYVLQYSLPQNIATSELRMAILEMYIDIDARELNGYRNPSPLLEVYALTEALDGNLDSTKLRRPSPTVRNVRVGEKRLVRLDITEIMNYHINEPSMNHGLVVGSLTGGRNGLFTLIINELGDTIGARVTVVYRSRLRP